MILINHLRAYENWVPVVARVLFGLEFLMGAAVKIPGTQSFFMEVGMTGAAGVPFPLIAVALAFVLELSAGLAMVVGWHAREAALVLAVFALALALIFFHTFADQTQVAEFINTIALMAGLLYVSVYGAQHAAVRRDPLP